MKKYKDAGVGGIENWDNILYLFIYIFNQTNVSNPIKENILFMNIKQKCLIVGMYKIINIKDPSIEMEIGSVFF